MIEFKVVTARKASKIVLTANNTSIKSNNEDVLADLFDDNGNPAKSDNKKITFTINGEAKLLGIDNGWKNSAEKFQSNKGTTYNGKTLLIIQAKDKSGVVNITANAEGLQESSIQVTIQ